MLLQGLLQLLQRQQLHNMPLGSQVWTELPCACSPSLHTPSKYRGSTINNALLGAGRHAQPALLKRMPQPSLQQLEQYARGAKCRPERRLLLAACVTCIRYQAKQCQHLEITTITGLQQCSSTLCAGTVSDISTKANTSSAAHCDRNCAQACIDLFSSSCPTYGPSLRQCWQPTIRASAASLVASQFTAQTCVRSTHCFNASSQPTSTAAAWAAS